jgi:hypothetical protein
MNLKVVSFLISFFLVYDSEAQLNESASYDLRVGKVEWSFTPPAKRDSQLVIHFNSTRNTNVKTLVLTQAEVTREWKVMLNHNHLGNLVPDENKMTTVFRIPAGLLSEKNNTLTIFSESSNTDRDDITISGISIMDHPPEEYLSEVTVSAWATDERNRYLPSRLTIVNQKGALQPVSADPGDTLAIRTGVIYSSTGIFTLKMPAGKYKLYASRGFEYGVDSTSIHVHPRDMLLRRFTIKHEVVLNNWKSCDTHIHTNEYSGHGDASMQERAITIAGEGLDYAVVTEHNAIVDIHDLVKRLNLNKWFTPISGDELTTKVGHFNVFPATNAPSPNIKTWNEIEERVNDSQVLILNHARDEHNGFRPFDRNHHISVAGKNTRGWKLPFNAMEVMNSGSQQTNPRRLYLDWMGLMNRGIFLTPVGSSDSHDVSRFIVGQARTYIQKDADVINNFLKGRVGVSFGLFTELTHETVNDKINITVKIYSPSWIHADSVTVYANREKIFSSAISKQTGKRSPITFQFSLKKPSHDVVLVAVAEGPDPRVSWWPIAKPFQDTFLPTTPLVLGISGAVKVDADGDKKFTSAYDYAMQLWNLSGKKTDIFIQSLPAFDEAVIVQAASILSDEKVDLSTLKVTGKVKSGFNKYRKEEIQDLEKMETH